MKTIRIAVVFAALLTGLFWESAAHAATYYIDPLNGKESNDGTSPATAKKTIGGVRRVVRPGDTVYLRGTAHFPYYKFDREKWSGTAGSPITVESYPGETAVFDPGYEEFKKAPQRNNAWVRAKEGKPPEIPPDPNSPEIPPYPNAHDDEYVSMKTYPEDSRWGALLTAENGTTTYRLLTYSKLEELRADNESFIRVLLEDLRPGGRCANNDPSTKEDDRLYKWLWTYRGPGLWWDESTGRIHIRLSHTHRDGGATNYEGETDPRKIPISVTYDVNKATSIRGNYMTFRNIVFQNGGDGMCGVGYKDNVSDNVSDHVTMERCTFNASRFGLTITNTDYFKAVNCEFNGRLGGWVSRDDVKDAYEYVDDETEKIMKCGTANMTCDGLFVVSGNNNKNWEVANCEFRNGHDAMQVFGSRIRIHHNLYENINDEVFYFNNPRGMYEDIRVYNNVIRKALHALSFSDGKVNGPRYIYRNIFDQRLPVLGYHRMVADGRPIWRVAGDFKANGPLGERYVYQNTFLLMDADSSVCSEAFDGAASDSKTRCFMNNIHMTISTDEPLYRIPCPAGKNFSDGNIWCRRITNATAPLINNYEDLKAMHEWYPNWEANSQIAYPQFVNVPDFTTPTDGSLYSNVDYRLKKTSPARWAGVDLTGKGWPDSENGTSTPDIGALPYGAPAVAVGIDGRYVFPDRTTPVAEAGNYSGFKDIGDNGFETVTLNGKGSDDPDGSISSYEWKLNGCTISTALTASVTLPTGTSKVYLTVTDDSGTSATDMREITIIGYENAVFNPGFESGSTAWTLNSGASIVTSPAYFSCQALQLVGAVTESSAQQLVPLTPGIPLTISGWAKTVGLPAGKYFSYKLSWLNSTGGTISETIIGSNLLGTNDWTLCTATFTPPAGAFTAKIQPALEAGSIGGTAYFDNAFIGVANRIRNPYFERGLTDWVVQKGRAAINTVSGNVRSGAMSLAMSPPVYTNVSQNVMGLTGTTTFSGWVKTVDMANRAEILIQWLDKDGDAMGGTVPIGSSTGTSDGFVQITASKSPEFKAEVAAEVAGVQVQLRHAEGTGTCYFDDIVVRKGP